MWVRVINGNEIAEIAKDMNTVDRLNDTRLAQEVQAEGWVQTEEGGRPPYDSLLEKIVRRNPVVGLIDEGALIAGKWVVGYDIVATTAQEQADRKTAKKNEIKAAMRAEAAVGVVNTSLGFPVDCRREGFDNDMQNIGAMIRRGVGIIRDANNVEHNVTPSQLTTIQDEMDLYGLGLYQKKWILESQVDAATTGAELDAVIW